MTTTHHESNAKTSFITTNPNGIRLCKRTTDPFRQTIFTDYSSRLTYCISLTLVANMENRAIFPQRYKNYPRNDRFLLT